MFVSLWWIGPSDRQPSSRALALLTALKLYIVPSVDADDVEIVFSVRSWEGEYKSREIPGGVKATPCTSSINSIRNDRSDPKKLLAIENVVRAAPVFSPDAKWLYFQSNASGEYHF